MLDGGEATSHPQRRIVEMGVLSVRDQALAVVVRDVVQADSRVADAKLSLEVHGGVVHVEGRAGSEAQRQLVREVIARFEGSMPSGS